MPTPTEAHQFANVPSPTGQPIHQFPGSQTGHPFAGPNFSRVALPEAHQLANTQSPTGQPVHQFYGFPARQPVHPFPWFLARPPIAGQTISSHTSVVVHRFPACPIPQPPCYLPPTGFIRPAYSIPQASNLPTAAGPIGTFFIPQVPHPLAFQQMSIPHHQVPAPLTHLMPLPQQTSQPPGQVLRPPPLPAGAFVTQGSGQPINTESEQISTDSGPITSASVRI